MNAPFLVNFRKQLGHWAFHGFFNALPSFIVAAFFLRLHSPAALLAMVSAIGFYVMVFAVITSLPGPLAEQDHPLSRAIRLGTKIRTGIACVSLPLVIVGPYAIFLAPDTWCGFLAVVVQNKLAEWLGVRSSSFSVDGGGALMRFLPVFTTTMLEGFIISFLLLMISFFCVMFIQARERRKMLREMGNTCNSAV